MSCVVDFVFVLKKKNEGMADYQHVIPVHADVARRKKRSWSEMEEPLFGECFVSMFLLLQLNVCGAFNGCC